jgi:hypothetical protein
MPEIVIRIIGDDADALARRLVGDVNASDIAAEAHLARRPARDGEKGAIEAVGSVLITVLGSGGLERLVGLLKDLVSRGGPVGSHQRAIELATPDGSILKLEGRMSDEEFTAVADRVLRLMEGRSGDGAP